MNPVASPWLPLTLSNQPDPLESVDVRYWDSGGQRVECEMGGMALIEMIGNGDVDCGVWWRRR